MEHRSADWPEDVDSSDSSPAGHREFPESGAGERASAGSGEVSVGGASVPVGGEDDALPRPGTGEPRVDAALRLLDTLADMPVSEHPGLYERVHAQLSDVLGELDTGPRS